MTSKEALYLLMKNQKNVRDDFRFIDLNTHEKVSIEECYDIVIKDLEILEIIKNHILNFGINTSGIYLEFHNGYYEPYYTIEIKEGIKKIVSTEEYDLLREVLL